jgi:hypothetical protein
MWSSNNVMQRHTNIDIEMRWSKMRKKYAHSHIKKWKERLENYNVYFKLMVEIGNND